jgi:hypothetical protein
MNQECNHKINRGSGIHADAQYLYSGLSLIGTHGLQTISVIDQMIKPPITIETMDPTVK